MKFEYIFFHICDFCEFHIETYSPCFILQYCEIRLYIIQNLPLLQCLFQKFFICVFSHMGQISGFYLCKFFEIFKFKHSLRFQCVKQKHESGSTDLFSIYILWKVLQQSLYMFKLWIRKFLCWAEGHVDLRCNTTPIKHFHVE